MDKGGELLMLATGVYLTLTFFSMRYLVAGSSDMTIKPIFYVVGALFGVILIPAALIKWLFQGRA